MSRQAVLKQLNDAGPLIAPSMLKCDFGNLHREVALLELAGARLLHLDVMDGHFVPNLSYGPMVIQRVRLLTGLPFDAHLMISEPDRYLDEYLQAGCDLLTVHVEAVTDPCGLLRRIRNSDAVAGLALNPGTPVEAIRTALPECDLVLVMSVEPGFGGQRFISSAIDKLRRLREMIEPGTLLSIDGGIDSSTIGDAARAGANVFAAGSAIFGARDYAEAIAELAGIARESRGEWRVESGELRVEN